MNKLAQYFTSKWVRVRTAWNSENRYDSVAIELLPIVATINYTIATGIAVCHANESDNQKRFWALRKVSYDDNDTLKQHEALLAKTIINNNFIYDKPRYIKNIVANVIAYNIISVVPTVMITALWPIAIPTVIVVGCVAASD